jgi:hypothetical protein
VRLLKFLEHVIYTPLEALATTELQTTLALQIQAMEARQKTPLVLVQAMLEVVVLSLFATPAQFNISLVAQ